MPYKMYLNEAAGAETLDSSTYMPQEQQCKAT